MTSPYVPTVRRKSYSECRRVAKHYFGQLVRFWRVPLQSGHLIQIGFEQGKEKTLMASGRDYQEALDAAMVGVARMLQTKAKADAEAATPPAVEPARIDAAPTDHTTPDSQTHTASPETPGT